MKKMLKNEIALLLQGKQKQDLVIALCPAPGVYKIDGKELNTPEFESYISNCEKVIILTKNLIR